MTCKITHYTPSKIENWYIATLKHDNHLITTFGTTHTNALVFAFAELKKILSIKK